MSISIDSLAHFNTALYSCFKFAHSACLSCRMPRRRFCGNALSAISSTHTSEATIKDTIGLANRIKMPFY